MEQGKKIGFLGVGNMGGAILRGYSGYCRREAPKEAPQFLAYRRDRKALEEICRQCGATPCDSPEELAASSDILFLGVKPKDFAALLPRIREHLPKESLLVSMAAGITLAQMAARMGEDAKLIRIMPNTPAQVGEAMTALCHNEAVSEAEAEEILAIFRTMGRAEKVEEALIHCVVAVSGSSPAYAYMFIDALIQRAVAHGMAPEKARVFAAQAVLGAAKMVLASPESPEQLRINVCSPGGTTIQAVEVLQEKDLEGIVGEAFDAALERSREMAGESK